MEIIIVIGVLGLAAYWVYDMSQKKKTTESDQLWPFGEKLSEGKIHVKPADVAPGKSEADRVEAPAPVVTNSTPADNVPVAETKKVVKKRQFVKRTDAAEPAKKPAAKKPAATKKTPAKKKPTQ
jgi:hypothetical protein